MTSFLHYIQVIYYIHNNIIYKYYKYIIHLYIYIIYYIFYRYGKKNPPSSNLPRRYLPRSLGVTQMAVRL